MEIPKHRCAKRSSILDADDVDDDDDVEAVGCMHFVATYKISKKQSKTQKQN